MLLINKYILKNNYFLMEGYNQFNKINEISGLFNMNLQNKDDYNNLNISFNKHKSLNHIPSSFNLNQNFTRHETKMSFNINEKITNLNNPSAKEGINLMKPVESLKNKSFLSVISNFDIYLNTLNNNCLNINSTYSGHTGRVNDIVSLKDYPVFASGGEDGKLKIWSLEINNKPIKEFKLDSSSQITSLDVYKDFLLIGTGKGNLNIINIKTMKTVGSSKLHSDRISHIKVYNDIDNKSYLLTTGEDSLCNVIEIEKLISNQISKQKTNENQQFEGDEFESVENTLNSGQNMQKMFFLNNHRNFLYSLNFDETLTVFNLENNMEILKFDAKNDILGTDYILDYSSSNNDSIQILIGNNNGAVIESCIDYNSNNIWFNSIIQSSCQQRFSSYLRIDENVVLSSDEGFYYII